MNVITSIPPAAVPHVIKGEIITGTDADYGRFRTPALNLNDLVWARSAPPPAADVPVAEILDIMVALGHWLTRDPAGAVEQAFLASRPLSTLEPGLLERSYQQLGALFNRDWMQFAIDQELGGTNVLDGWREVVTPSGRTVRSRAFPPRLIHVVAGNAAGVTALTVLRGAISKGVHLIKLPSNDLFTAAAILQGLSAVAPGHPTARSFSAAYWRGGDRAVESMLFRPVYFDKLVAWGGEATIRSAKEYIGPGFELVAFDPKTSISLIGREVHDPAASSSWKARPRRWTNIAPPCTGAWPSSGRMPPPAAGRCKAPCAKRSMPCVTWRPTFGCSVTPAVPASSSVPPSRLISTPMAASSTSCRWRGWKMRSTRRMSRPKRSASTRPPGSANCATRWRPAVCSAWWRLAARLM
jgi:hypothetical protein